MWHGPAGDRHSTATLDLRSCVMNPIDLILTSVATDAQGTVKARRILDRCPSASPSHGMRMRLRLGTHEHNRAVAAITLQYLTSRRKGTHDSAAIDLLANRLQRNRIDGGDVRHWHHSQGLGLLHNFGNIPREPGRKLHTERLSLSDQDCKPSARHRHFQQLGLKRRRIEDNVISC